MKNSARKLLLLAVILVMTVLCLTVSAAAADSTGKCADEISALPAEENASPYGFNFTESGTTVNTPKFAGDTDGLEKIKVNQTWNGSWAASITCKYIYLTVDKTGFYDLTVEDLKKPGRLTLRLYDLDYPGDEDDENWRNTNVYLSTTYSNSAKNIYLIKDHLYEIAMQYEKLGTSGSYINADANVNVKVSSNSYTMSSLTLGTNKNLTVGNNTTDWLEFKTSASGDFLFKVNQTSALYIDIYEKVSGEYEASASFESATSALMKLKKDTEYIIVAFGTEESSKLVRFSVSKAEKDITGIDIAQNIIILAHNGYIYEEYSMLYPSVTSNLCYKITYANGTTETLSYSDCQSRGITISGIYYLGGYYNYGSEYFFKSGKQSVAILFMNGLGAYSYVNISTYLDWCSDIVTNTDFDEMRIAFADYKTYTYFYKIRPKQTTYYGFYSSNWNQISVDLTIFDKDNKVVADNGDSTWSLKAGQEYCLRMEYAYNDGCSDDVIFHLEAYRDHRHSVARSEATKATLTKNGKVKNICACGYVISTSTVYYPKTIKLSSTSYTCDGKVKTPTVTVKDSKGNTLTKDKHYTVSYSSGRKTPGKYTVTIKFRGNRTGTKTLSFTIKPKAVSSISVSRSASSIKLSWPKVTGATGYRVYKYNTKTKDFDKVKDITGTSITFSKLSAATKYKYKVKPYAKSGSTLYWGSSKEIETVTSPATPSITVKSPSKGKIALTWTNVSGESGYEVWWSTKSDSGFKKLATVKANATSLNLKGTSGVTYYFRVRASMKTSSGTIYGGYRTVSVKVK